MMTYPIPTSFLLLAVPVLAVFYWLFWGPTYKFEKIVRKWAESNGLKILSLERRRFGTPFNIFFRSNAQRVFFIEVLDSKGKERSGFVLCGDWILGHRVEKITVKWNFSSGSNQLKSP